MSESVVSYGSVPPALVSWAQRCGALGHGRAKLTRMILPAAATGSAAWKRQGEVVEITPCPPGCDGVSSICPAFSGHPDRRPVAPAMRVDDFCARVVQERNTRHTHRGFLAGSYVRSFASRTVIKGVIIVRESECSLSNLEMWLWSAVVFIACPKAANCSFRGRARHFPSYHSFAQRSPD